jgi:Putative prokaryotic signal transducing protein
MHFTSQEIFLFIILVPLLVFVGKKIRGSQARKELPHEAASGLPHEIRRKIEKGFYREGNTVLLESFGSDVEANIVRGLLIDNDIYAELRDEILGATRFNYSYVVGGVKLFVHEREIDAARRLLEEHRQITNSGSPDWKWRLCPKCGSDLLSYQKYHPVSALILFLGAPFFPLRRGAGFA